MTWFNGPYLDKHFYTLHELQILFFYSQSLLKVNVTEWVIAINFLKSLIDIQDCIEACLIVN